MSSPEFWFGFAIGAILGFAGGSLFCFVLWDDADEDAE